MMSLFKLFKIVIWIFYYDKTTTIICIKNKTYTNRWEATELSVATINFTISKLRFYRVTI